MAVAGLLLAAGCTSAPTAEPAPTTGTVVPGAPVSSAALEAEPLTVDVTIADGQVSPNGEKLLARVGQPVVLNVTSDVDDEVHAHTGGNGFELEVPAGTPTTGRFSVDQPGSFEVESHHLEKVIVILNVS